MNDKIKPTLSLIIFSLLSISIIISGSFYSSILFYISVMAMFFIYREINKSWQLVSLCLLLSIFSMIFFDNSGQNVNLTPQTKIINDILGLNVSSTFFIYTIKIFFIFILITLIRPKLENNFRLYLDIISSLFLIYIYTYNTDFYSGNRLAFKTGFDRLFPGSTAVYCFLFMVFAFKMRLPIFGIISLSMGYMTQSRSFSITIMSVILCYIFLPIVKKITNNTGKLIIIYLLLGFTILWILELITLGIIPEVRITNERIFQFNALPVRLNWELLGLKEWTSSMQNIMWGVGNWQDIGPNPHHSLIQTLLERGIIVTATMLIFIMNQISNNIKGMEPWVIGFFIISYFFPMNLISVYWLILLTIFKCDNVEINNSILMKKIKNIIKIKIN